MKEHDEFRELLPENMHEFYDYDKQNQYITWSELEALYKADLSVRSLPLPKGDLTEHILEFIQNYHIVPQGFGWSEDDDITKSKKTDLFRLEPFEIDKLLYVDEDGEVKECCDYCNDKESIYSADIAFESFYIKLHYPLLAHKILSKRYCTEDCATAGFLDVMDFATDKLTIDHSAIRNSYIHFLRNITKGILAPQTMTIAEMSKHYKLTHEGINSDSLKQLKKFAAFIGYSFDKTSKLFVFKNKA